LKSPKHFLVQHGEQPQLGEVDHDYTIVVTDYQTEREDTSSEKNIRYRKQDIEPIFPDETPAPIRTFLNLGLAIYAADRLVKRGPTGAEQDDERMLQSREIDLTVPVSDIERWRGVEEEISHTISFISRDTFSVRFVEANHHHPSSSVSNSADISPSETDSVALFSGGLDSLGGYYHLTENGYNPEFVCLDHGKNVGHIVAPLQEYLELNLTKVGIEEGFRCPESTQFTRSFMYLTFATAVAVGLDVEEIFVPENGILARFPMLSSGWTTTRTVHPTFLRGFNRILSEVFPQTDLKVTNPFVGMTKTEVVNQIPNEDTIHQTRTCPHPRGLSREKTERGHPMNCGVCIPCLIRQIGLVTSHHQIKPDELAFESNPLSEFDFSTLDTDGLSEVSASERQTGLPVFLIGLNSILSFAQRVKTQTQTQIASDYPEALDDSVYNLYSQFSQETISAVSVYTKFNESLEEYIRTFSPELLDS
jgi:7-cyano-7-deazaguanine synthase in queuosine biosynthesis